MSQPNKKEPNFKDVAKNLGMSMSKLGKTKIRRPIPNKRSLKAYFVLGLVIVLLVLSAIFFILAYIPARLLQGCSKAIYVLSLKYGRRPQ